MSAWLVAEGDTVSLNQPLVEIETAKATVEVPAPFAGRVARLHVAAGETLAVGAPLATFEVDGPAEASSVTATPAVRKLARDLGVDLSMVSGSVRAAGWDARGRPGVRTDRRRTRSRPASDRGNRDPHSPTRRAIADRLTEVAAIPQVTTFRPWTARPRGRSRRLGVSPLPVFVRALAEVCRDHPMLNASWDGDRILFHDVRVGSPRTRRRDWWSPCSPTPVRSGSPRSLPRSRAWRTRHARTP